MLRLTDYLERKPKALSGGQRQRVAIGRAIVRDPKIFLFDEPLSNLDAELRVATRKELAALHAEIGGTMIYVTHDQVEAMTLADRIVVLRAGRIEQVGTPLELYNSPDNLFVAGFIGSPRMNFLPARWCRRRRHASPDCSAQREVALRARRSGLAGGRGGDARHPARAYRRRRGDRACSTLTVDLVEQLGGETYLYATAPGLPQITLRQDGQVPCERGERARRSVSPPSHLHLFDARPARALTVRTAND